MPLTNILAVKDSKITYQPLLLAELTLVNGQKLFLSTENLDSTEGGVQYRGNDYKPRIQSQSMSPLQWTTDGGIVQSPQVTLTLADPDGFIWDTCETDPNPGLQGAKIVFKFVFYDAIGQTFSSDELVKFVGICNPPQEANDETLTLLFTNILNFSTLNLPTDPIQRTCPYLMPSTLAQRQDGCDNPDSDFFKCGYSPDVASANAVGNLDPSTGQPFTTCDYTFQSCIARLGDASLPTTTGFTADPPFVQIEKDTSGRSTARFGGIQYYPPLDWRGRAYISGSIEENINNPNDAKYSDYFPLMFGTGFINPPVMNVVGSANYTAMEVVICLGQIHDDFNTEGPIQQVIVNDELIPFFKNRTDSLLCWSWVSLGSRNGHVNKNAIYNGAGDPYGSLACIEITVPVKVSGSDSIPNIKVLTSGPKIRVYTDPSTHTMQYTDNAVWNFMEVLTWCNLEVTDLDVQSFINAAAIATVPISYIDLTGVIDTHPRYQSGFALRQRVSASAEIQNLLAGFKGILAPSASLDPATSGKLQLFIKQTLADQQPSPIPGSNDNVAYDSAAADGTDAAGFVAYHFDESNIMRKGPDRNSPSTFTIKQRPVADTPNKLIVNIQDEDFQYAPDSMTVADSEHIGRAGITVSGTVSVDGLVNYDQSKRVVQTQFAEQFRGNPRSGEGGVNDCGGTWQLTFDVSFRAIHLRVGHIVAVSFAKYELDAQLFRVLSIAPSQDCQKITLLLQWHEDDWYLDSYGQNPDPTLQSKRRKRTARVPYGLLPNETAPIDGDALYSFTEKGMAFDENYNPDVNDLPNPEIDIRFFEPANVVSGKVGSPFAPQATATDTGGRLQTGIYYLGICAIDDEGKFSAPSFPMAKVAVTGPTGQIVIPNIFWQSGTVQWRLYASTDPNHLSLQLGGVGTPDSINMIDYAAAGEPPPDIMFDHTKIRYKHLAWVGGGVFGFAVQGIPSLNVIQAQLTGYPPNFFAGRVLYYAAHNPTSSEDIMMLNWVISASDDTSFTVIDVYGNPIDVAGAGVEINDVMYVRPQAAIVSPTTIGDPLFVLPFPTQDPSMSVLGASNTTPIVLEVPAGNGFMTGDNVVVAGVTGNPAANGTTTATVVDATHISLDGTAGNGPYENGGTIALLRNGLEPHAYKGKEVIVIAGPGRYQKRDIVDNDATTLTIDRPWDVLPTFNSVFILTESSWLGEINSKSAQHNVPTEVQLSLQVNPYIRFPGGDGILFQAFTENSDETKESTDASSPFRDIWIQPGPPGKSQYDKATWNLAVSRSISVGVDVAPHYNVKRVGTPNVAQFKAKIPPIGSTIMMDVKIAKADGSYTGTIFDGSLLTIPDGSSDWQTLDPSHFLPGLVFNDEDTLTVDVTQVGATTPGMEITIVLKWPIN